MNSAQPVIDFFKLLPKWLTVFTVLFVLVYFSALTIIAVSTERDVTLIPPKLGPGPKHQLAREIQELRNTIKEMSDAHFKQVSFLREHLATTREKSASSAAGIYSDLSRGGYEYRENAYKYETEIKELDTKFSDRITDLQKKLMELQQRLEGAGVINPNPQSSPR